MSKTSDSFSLVLDENLQLDPEGISCSLSDLLCTGVRFFFFFLSSPVWRKSSSSRACLFIHHTVLCQPFFRTHKFFAINAQEYGHLISYASVATVSAFGLICSVEFCVHIRSFSIMTQSVLSGTFDVYHYSALTDVINL